MRLIFATLYRRFKQRIYMRLHYAMIQGIGYLKQFVLAVYIVNCLPQTKHMINIQSTLRENRFRWCNLLISVNQLTIKILTWSVNLQTTKQIYSMCSVGRKLALFPIRKPQELATRVGETVASSSLRLIFVKQRLSIFINYQTN